MIGELIRILTATLGTLGFALVFRVRHWHLFWATAGGTLSWIAYIITTHVGGGIFLSSLVGALTVCLWSELMARWRKAPASIYLIPGIVPLLPGSALYYAMEGAIYSDMAVFTQRGIDALLASLGIAGGILIASEIVRIVLMVRYKAEKK